MPLDNSTLVYTHTIRRMINVKYSCIAPKTLPLNPNQVRDFKNRLYVLKDTFNSTLFLFSDKQTTLIQNHRNKGRREKGKRKKKKRGEEKIVIMKVKEKEEKNKPLADIVQK